MIIITHIRKTNGKQTIWERLPEPKRVDNGNAFRHEMQQKNQSYSVDFVWRREGK